MATDAGEKGLPQDREGVGTAAKVGKAKRPTLDGPGPILPGRCHLCDDGSPYSGKVHRPGDHAESGRADNPNAECESDESFAAEMDEAADHFGRPGGPDV